MPFHDLRSAPPARGILSAPAPDGRIEGFRVLPPEALAPFIHHFWSVRWALRTPFIASALPHPSVQIVLEEKGQARRAQVFGVPLRRLSIRIAGEGHRFGIAFRPAMFQPLLRASTASLTDRVAPLAQLLGADTDAWMHATLAEPDLTTKIAITSAFLLPRLPPIARVRPLALCLRDLVERMRSDRSLLRVQDVCAETGLDMRTLQRGFGRYVGVSPKWVLRRYRLHEASEQLRGRHPPSLAALAASLDYADQSHFARDFTSVIGQTPRSFARAHGP